VLSEILGIGRVLSFKWKGLQNLPANTFSGECRFFRVSILILFLEYGLSLEAQSTEMKFKEKMVIIAPEDVAKLRIDPNFIDKWRGVGNAIVTPRGEYY
jgi:hypothetical protein